MTLPLPTDADVHTFQRQGFLVVPDAVPVATIDMLAARATRIRESQLAMDWSQGSTRPEDQVLQGMLELDWLEWRTAAFHQWTLSFASALMGAPLALWYNQLLDKPPRVGAATFWHQDGALMGADGGDRLISCWMPLQDVDVSSGCMHFLDGGHQQGILEHEVVHGDQPDCSRGACVVDPARVVAAPLGRGGVTFHHGLMPHMTHENRAPHWRQVLIQRFFEGRPPGSGE